MVRLVSFAGVGLLFLFSSLAMAQAPTLPPLTGVVPDVSSINTAALLAQMNHGSSDLVLVAAHRGYWVNAPENSTQAITDAFNSGIEVIEIDVRTTSDNHLIISHDPDLIKETTGSGLVSETTEDAIQALQVRNRKGHPQSESMLTFEQVLTTLKIYSFGGRGPVVIVDIKDRDPWPAYLEGVKDVAAKLDSSTQPAILFKMKMKNLPTIDMVQAQASAHPSYGHLVLTINPEDANSSWSPTSTNFQTLLQMSKGSQPFVQQFELNSLSPGDPASFFVGRVSNLANSFATYWEPRFYPEGVSTIRSNNGIPYTTCCNLPTPLTSDLRGVLNFALYYNSVANPGVSLITTDGPAEILDFLSSLGLRNVTEIQ